MPGDPPRAVPGGELGVSPNRRHEHDAAPAGALLVVAADGRRRRSGKAGAGQHDDRAAEPATSEPRAMDIGMRLAERDQDVDVRRRYLVVVAHRRVRGIEQQPDGMQVPGPQCRRRGDDPAVLADDMPRPACQQRVGLFERR